MWYVSTSSSSHYFLFASTRLGWTFHVVDFFDLEPLMADCKYNTTVFSVAVRVSSWHLCDGFVLAFLCVDGTAAFLGSVKRCTTVTVCTPPPPTPPGKIIFAFVIVMQTIIDMLRFGFLHEYKQESFVSKYNSTGGRLYFSQVLIGWDL